MSWADTYETRWSRVKRRYYRNEFLARRVTADDREYLERFLKHGPITMETVNTRTGFLIEELGFWHQPYGTDVTVERRVGPAVEEPIIPDADGAADKARRQRNKRDSQTARETMKSEHEQWRAAREKRELLQRQADIEWEKARAEAFSPYASGPSVEELRKKYRPLSPRHHVPRWQIEEIAAAEMAVTEAEEKRRSAATLERIAKLRARDQAEQTAIDLALQAEQEEIERIERQAIEAARRAWEEERGIGGELEAIFDDQPPPPVEEE